MFKYIEQSSADATKGEEEWSRAFRDDMRTHACTCSLRVDDVPNLQELMLRLPAESTTCALHMYVCGCTPHGATLPELQQTQS